MQPEVYDQQEPSILIDRSSRTFNQNFQDIVQTDKTKE